MSKFLILSLSFAILLFCVSFLTFNVYTNKKLANVNSYESCISAGYETLLIYPPICTTPDGRTFTDLSAPKVVPPADISDIPSDICENLCGDNTCQEIVCLGTGCPCAETVESCPADCVVEK
ncbi:MAG: hypothetical protein ACOZAO_01045 [Patescibacteria group bacterium]